MRIPFFLLGGLLIFLLVGTISFYLGVKSENNQERNIVASPITRVITAVPSPTITVIPLNKYNVSCQTDMDCQLIDTQIAFNCPSFSCESIDYSLDRWKAVNVQWYASEYKKVCPNPNKYMLPNCDPMATNTDYRAACLQNTCQKVPLGFPTKVSSTTVNSFVACGCGCCGGVTPVSQCLYHSKGDSMETVIKQDQKVAKNPQCSLMGCAAGVQYHWCD